MAARVSFAVSLCVACSSPVAPHMAAPLPDLEPLPIGTSDPAYRLPPQKAFYFAHEGDVAAKYIELRTNGTYRTVQREHMGVGESDAGRWRQVASGDLHLCSEYQFNPIQAGPLWIVVANSQQHEELPDLARALRRILASSAAAAFRFEDIEWPLSGGATDYHHPSVNSDAFGHDVTRLEVERLVAVVDSYVAGVTRT